MGGGRRWIALLAAVGLSAAAACSPGASETDGTRSPPTSSVPTVADDPRPAPVTTDAEDEFAVPEPLRWSSLEGPPGGNVAELAQDPVRPDDFYAITWRGAYRSTDGGASWTLLHERPNGGLSRSLAFDDRGVYTCDDGGLMRFGVDGGTDLLPIGCDKVVADGSSLFVAQSSRAFEDFRVGLFRGQPELPEDEWTDVTPPYGDVAAGASPDAPFLSITNLTATSDGLLAVVALGLNEDDFSQVDTDVYLSADAGATWTSTDPGFPDGTVVRRLFTEPATGWVIALSHSRDAFVPLRDLVRVSRDGGRSWSPLTGIDDVLGGFVADVDVLPDRYVLTNLDESIIELDRDEPNVIVTRRAMPRVEGFSISFSLDEIVFDVRDPQIALGRNRVNEGLLRSVDGGATWSRVTSGIVAPSVGNVHVDPADGDVMVASGNLGYLPHITHDGGATWEPMIGSSSMTDEVAFDPHDPDRILAVSELSVLLESGDGGRTWTRIADEFRGNRVSDLASAPDGDIVYAANLGSNVTAITGVRPGDDQPIGEGDDRWINLDGSPDYPYSIEVAPDGTLFASSSPRKFEDHASVWRHPPGIEPSIEAWTEVLRVEGAAGVTDLAIGPGDPWRVYAGVTGDDPGVWASDDRGETWAELHGGEFGFVTVHAVAADTDSGRMWAAPWGGGLFRSDDAGGTWTELASPTVSVAAIVVDAAGERLLIGDRLRPVVWSSLDDGETWDPLVEFDETHYRVMALASTPEGVYVSLLDRIAPDEGVAVFDDTVPVTGSTFRLRDGEIDRIGAMTRSVLAFAEADDGLYAVTHLAGVHRIDGVEAVDVSTGLPDMGFNHLLVDDGVVYVAGGSDVDVRFEPRIGDPSVVHNIYRLDDDGAWSPLLDGDPFESPVKQVLADPSGSGVLFAVTGTGVYASGDGGSTWRPENDGLEFGNIGAAAIIDGRLLVGTLGGGAAVASIDADGGLRWAPSTGPTVEIESIRLLTDPADDQRIWASSYPGGVFRTSDGGRTFVEQNFGIPSFEVADPLADGYYRLTVAPDDPDRLFLSISRHGIYTSANGGMTWRPLGEYGADRAVASAGLNDLVIDPTNPTRLWLATSELGVLTSNDGGTSWETLNEGLGTNHVLALERTADGVLVAGTSGYGVYVLEPGATAWTHLDHSVGVGHWQTWERRLYQYSSLRFDKANAGRIYLAHFPGGFFVSDDDGATWQSHNTGIGNDGMFSLSIHPEDPEVFLAGSYNGILRSEDAGRTWFDSSSGMPAEQWPFVVLFDDENPDIVYTATKNGMNKGFCDRNLDTFCGVVMKSVDGGATWTSIDADLPTEAEFYGLVFHPDDHDVLYLSSSRGVFASADAGGHWTLVSEGLPVENFIVRENVAHTLDLTPDGTTLVLAIVGYGVWTAPLPS